MKKILAGLIVMGTAAFFSAQSITFNETTLDYGKVAPNADGNRVFVVKNTGDKPLLISSVRPQCGCTTPEWSQEPIMPGKTGKIKVHYNTSIHGPFQKLIEVFSNDPVNGRSVIFIKGDVDPNAPQPTVAQVAGDVKQAARTTGRVISNAAKKGARAVKKGVQATGAALKE